jgi:hypothetical protein
MTTIGFVAAPLRILLVSEDEGTTRSNSGAL